MGFPQVLSSKSYIEQGGLIGEVAVLKWIPMGFGSQPVILITWTATEFSFVFALVWVRHDNS